MPKTKISEFSATPGNNTDIDGINIGEGCAPSGINDAIRELMAQLKDFQAGTAGDSFNGPIGSVTPAAGAFTTLSASGTTTLSGLTASTSLALDASKNVTSVTNTGTGNNVLATSPTLVTPNLGTPSAVTLTNATGLPISTGVTGMAAGAATFLTTPSSANLASLVTDETGTGALVFAGSPTFTGTVNGAALTLSSSLTLNGGTANGVAYLNGSKVLTSGSALTFDGSKLSLPTTLAIKGAQNGNTAKIAMTRTDISYSLNNETDLRFYGQTTDTESPANILHSMSVGGTFIWNQAGASELMRLTSVGLGIGTSSPAYKLEVRGASNPVIALNSTDTSGVTIAGLVNGGSNGIGAIQFFNGGTIGFDTGATGASQATKMRLDASGNLGLGVTPSAWGSGFSAIDLGGNSRISGNTSMLIANNAFFNGTNWIYKNTGTSATYVMPNSGGHQWYTAPSGTAGNAISFTQAMTLAASGGLSVGATSDAGAKNILLDAGGKLCGNAPTGSTSSTIELYNASTGNMSLTAAFSTAAITFASGGTTERARIPSTGGFVVGTAALATNATTGFLYVPTCAGTPTGTPATQTGTAPIVVDTTNNKLYFYSGGQWRDAGP